MAPSNVYLTGFMGSGKSTVGPLLAAHLGAAFVDLDATIEETVGVSIPTLFAEVGEAGFRRAERTVLETVASKRGLVVATGGGTLLGSGAFDLAATSGTVVYLWVSPDTLARRLEPEAVDRPLLYGDDGEPLEGEALHARIGTLLEDRSDAYERAHITVVTDDLPPGTVAGWIARTLADS